MSKDRTPRWTGGTGGQSADAKIEWIKRLACGYRNRERFRNAIYFHPGGLALYPDWLPTRNPEAAFFLMQ